MGEFNTNKSYKLNLLIKFLLLLNFLLSIYLIYKVNFFLNSRYLNHYYIYFFLNLLIYFFLIYLLKINVEKKKNYLTLFVSIVISLYLIEFVLRVLNIVEYRSKYEIYKTLEKQNSDIKVAIPPNVYMEKTQGDFIPLSGISNKITLMCNENNYWAQFNSDRYGFNNNDNNWDERIDNVLIGDSFGYGACVNQNENISFYLKEKFEMNTINLSYEGNGPLLEYASYIEYAKNIEYNNLIWLYFEGNDLNDLSKEIKNPILNKYLKKKNFNQNLINIDNYKNQQLNEFLNFEKKFLKIEKKKYKLFFGFIKLNSLRYLTKIHKLNFNKSKNNFCNLDTLENFFQIIKNVNFDLKMKNKKMLFVYLPDKNSFIENNNESICKNKIVKFLNNNKINYIDLIELKNMNNFDILKNFPVHLNKTAYQKVSEKIFKKLK